MTEESIEEVLQTVDEPEQSPDEPTQAEAETPEPETIGRPRDEAGRFTKTQDETGVESEESETEVEPPSTGQLPQEVYEPFRAVRTENRELKEQMAQLQKQLAQPQPEQKVGFWDDPDTALDQRLGQFGTQLLEQFTQQQLETKIRMSQVQLQQKYDDFDARIEEFTRLEQMNPALSQQALSHPDPLEFAYQTARQAKEVEQYGGIDGLLKAERAKWEAEAAAQVPTPTLPSTTISERSAGGRKGPEWTGPASMDNILSG